MPPNKRGAPPFRAIDRTLLRRWPLPLPVGGDKDARGCAFVVAGAPQMPGAAILAATAALRAGAGKLQIATCASIAPHVAAAVPEALVVSLEETPSGGIALSNAPALAERANRADAAVFGPGLLDEAACGKLVAAIVRRLTVPFVLDAAALDAAGENGGPFGPAVLTPHAGEMARMIGIERATIESAPAHYAREAASRFGAVVALKGQATFVAAPSGELYCNRAGTIGLATSGSGDTLAGIIGGILARGLEPLQAAVWGVFLHAQAGTRLEKRMGVGFLARELLAEIPAIMRSLAPAKRAGFSAARASVVTPPSRSGTTTRL